MKVEFAFPLESSVITAFGDEGIVRMCAVDDGGKQYYIATANKFGWYPERELKRFVGLVDGEAVYKSGDAAPDADTSGG